MSGREQLAYRVPVGGGGGGRIEMGIPSTYDTPLVFPIVSCCQGHLVTYTYPETPSDQRAVDRRADASPFHLRVVSGEGTSAGHRRIDGRVFSEPGSVPPGAPRSRVQAPSDPIARHRAHPDGAPVFRHRHAVSRRRQSTANGTLQNCAWDAIAFHVMLQEDISITSFFLPSVRHTDRRRALR